MPEEEYEYQSLEELADAMIQASEGPPAIEIWQDYDPSQRFVTVFPVTAEQGASSSTVAYYIFQPGQHSGLHADSGEEVMYVAQGTGEAFVSGKQEQLEEGKFLVVPAGVQHDVYAYGDCELRILSYFPVEPLETVFQEPVLPLGDRVMTSKLPRGPVVREITADQLPPELQHLAPGPEQPGGAAPDAG